MAQSVRGAFVCLEGIDGAGKNTQTKMLAERLRGIGTSPSVYSYPDYQSRYGRIIKDFLEKKIELTVQELFFLNALDMEKDRTRMTADMEGGRTVIADRYITSTVAYQTAGGFDFDSAKGIVSLSGLPSPDIAFYLDIPTDLSSQRKGKQKPGRLDRFESASEYLNKVRETYNRLYEERFFCKNWVRIDGNEDVAVVHEEIFLEVSRLFGLK